MRCGRSKEISDIFRRDDSGRRPGVGFQEETGHAALFRRGVPFELKSREPPAVGLFLKEIDFLAVVGSFRRGRGCFQPAGSYPGADLRRCRRRSDHAAQEYLV